MLFRFRPAASYQLSEHKAIAQKYCKKRTAEVVETLSVILESDSNDIKLGVLQAMNRITADAVAAVETALRVLLQARGGRGPARGELQRVAARVRGVAADADAAGAESAARLCRACEKIIAVAEAVPPVRLKEFADEYGPSHGFSYRESEELPILIDNIKMINRQATLPPTPGNPSSEPVFKQV